MFSDPWQNGLLNSQNCYQRYKETKPRMKNYFSEDKREHVKKKNYEFFPEPDQKWRHIPNSITRHGFLKIFKSVFVPSLFGESESGLIWLKIWHDGKNSFLDAVVNYTSDIQSFKRLEYFLASWKGGGGWSTCLTVCLPWSTSTGKIILWLRIIVRPAAAPFFRGSGSGSLQFWRRRLRIQQTTTTLYLTIIKTILVH